MHLGPCGVNVLINIKHYFSNFVNIIIFFQSFLLDFVNIIMIPTGGKFVVADQKIAGRNKAPLHLNSKQSRKLARRSFSG
jgi:hypothetical protein